jgi:LuxR family maltose regulon positive regulatory protein
LASEPAPTADRLVRAKLHLPEPHQELIDRTDLVDRLVDASGKRLVMIAAPAGYGKSTLIAQWRVALRERRAFAFVTLDHRDDDPGSLWTAILLALGDACPDLATDDLLTLVRIPLLDGPLVDTAVVPALLDRLNHLAEPVVLVLDDFHSISERACHEQIALFLRHLPSTCQLVVATRGCPPIGVARLRAAGDVVELGMSDLRFSATELGPFVRRIAARELADSDLAAIEERTEGWPAGAYLTALSMRGRDDPSQLIHDLTARDRYILDYLSEEVLAGLPDEIRQFLMRTSVLGRFTAALCDAVAETSNAAQLLDTIKRTNLFLISLDDDRCWFRYHHLFGLALRAQLTREDRDVEGSLHAIASAWLERAGLIDDAIEHAFAGGVTGRVIGLIAKHWPSYVNTGRNATVQRWLAMLGHDALSRDPAGAICAAWFAAFAGDRRVVQRWLATAESLPHTGPLPDGIVSVASAAALIRASFGLAGHAEMLHYARLAADLETDPASPWHGLAAMDLGYSLYVAGDVRAAIGPLERAVQSQATMPVVRIFALAALSLATGRLGRHAEADELAVAAHDLVYDHDLAETPHVSLAFTALGAVLANDGRPDRARAELEHSLRLRRRVRGLSPWPTLETLAILADVVLAQGDRDLARALHDEAADLLAALPDEDHRVRADLHAVRQRLDGPPAAPSLGAALTDREQTVLRLLQGSLSLAQIAAELFLSANTVKTHTRVIYQKLGASSRQDAVQRARELGLL